MNKKEMDKKMQDNQSKKKGAKMKKKPQGKAKTCCCK